jgi:pimeloyl-ACP methyl ester carboxylesterase
MLCLTYVLGVLAINTTGQDAPQPAGVLRMVPDGVGLYCEVAGEGHPIVLIHGGQLDRRMWDDQFTLLATMHRVIRYDIRGFGKSAAPTEPYGDVDDLLHLLDAFGIEKAHLVGLSLGGAIATDFTIAHPDRVTSLTAVAPGLSGFTGWTPETNARFQAVGRSARDDTSEATAELWLTDPLMAPAMEQPRLAARLRELSRDNARCWLKNPLLLRPLEPPAIGRLQEITVPTTLIVGSRDTREIQEIVGLMKAGIPHARSHVIDRAGHMVNMEKPVEFNAILSTLFGEPEARPASEFIPAIPRDSEASQDTAGLTDHEQQVLDRSNLERKKLKLPPYKASAVLTKVARAHAANMVKQRKLSHTLDNKVFSKRIEEAGYEFSAAGENIAQGQASGEEAVSDWMTSPGHKANILSKDYAEIGIGRGVTTDGDVYWVQVFARPAGSLNAPAPR